MTGGTAAGAGGRRAIGVGASAGGVDALLCLLHGLPPDLAAPVLVVLRLPACAHSVLGRQSRLPVRTGEEGEALRCAEILVAAPNRHLRVSDGRVRLDGGTEEHATRPAVDPLFRALADDYGRGAVAVVPSGALDDGSRGARAVPDAGGSVFVRDPLEAIVPEMPERTLEAVGDAAIRLGAGAIGARLGPLVAVAPTNVDDPVLA
jgi:two-component system chemotaxis response regulator CheB